MIRIAVIHFHSTWNDLVKYIKSFHHISKIFKSGDDIVDFLLAFNDFRFNFGNLLKEKANEVIKGTQSQLFDQFLLYVYSKTLCELVSKFREEELLADFLSSFEFSLQFLFEKFDCTNRRIPSHLALLDPIIEAEIST